MMITDLADIARSTGHPVTECPGWKTRTRPANPTSNPRGLLDVKTITIHETGLGRVPVTDMPSLAVLLAGRGGPDPVPGPLVQLGVGVSGRIYVVAAGMANHAGVSLKPAYAREHAIGIEIEASGHGLPGDFPPVQLDAAARLAAALQRRFPGAMIRGHKETCAPVGRKVDPHFSMESFRERAGRLAGTRPTTEDDDMALSDADLDKIAEKVWARGHKITEADVGAFGTKGLAAGTRKSMDELVRFSPAVARLRREHTAAIGALTGIIGALAEKIDNGATPGGFEAAAKRGAELALNDLAQRILDDDEPGT